MLNYNVYKQIRKHNIIKFSSNSALSLSSASGHGIKSVGYATIRMFINDQAYRITFIITKGFKFDILIGSDFIYGNKAKMDFANNTLTIKKHVVCLKPKNELPKCSLLEVASLQYIEPYSVAHIKVRSKGKVNGSCLISPLNTSKLFEDQPGLVSPSVAVISNNKGLYHIPVINNTGMRHTAFNKTVIGFMEHVDISDKNKNFDGVSRCVPASVHVNSVDPVNQTFCKNNKNVRLSYNVNQTSCNVNRKTRSSNSVNQNVGNTNRKAHTQHFSNSKPSYQVCNIDRLPGTGTEVNLGDSLSDSERQALLKLLNEHEQLFVSDNKELTRTNITQATLNTAGSQPIKQRPYKNPLALQNKLDDQLNEMLEAGIISPSCSPWSSPVVVVPKKDGSQRICIDYRKLNQTLVKDSFPLPRIEDLFATLGKARFFSCLDLKSSYWQIEMAPQDREKTAFCTRTQLLEFNVLPFGICSAPSLFQRAISKVLHGVEGKFAVAYLDDILVFSRTYEEHLKHIEDVFNRLGAANFSLNKSKCHFVKAEIDYLGHVISSNGIRPNPEKVRAIQTLDPPTNVKGVRSFLGMAGYYRNFIPQFSAIARPLTKLTKKNVHFDWCDEAQRSFEYLKAKLVTAPILAYPDVTKPYSLYTDASDFAVGGILTQDFEEGERVIQYVSHQLTPNRLHYPVIEKECFAIIYCITKLKQYLLGADVTVYTDHKPLKSLFTAEMKNTRVQRWAILLDEYQVKIKYRQGIHNGRADMLSRIRIKPTEQELEESQEILAIEQTKTNISKTHKNLPTYEHISFDTDINMKNEQQLDTHCINMIKELKQNNDKVANDYTIADDLLYHIAKLVRFETEPILQLVIPSRLKQVVLQGYHSDFGGGHVGIEKTYQKIRSRYFWPNCYKDVVEYVRCCEVCQRRMLRKQHAELQDSIQPHAPMEVVGIDTVGPFVTSSNGNNYIVTMVDWYSAWVEAYPVPNKEAVTIAKVILEHFVPQHGCPRVLVSDRGTEYVNGAIDYLSTTMKIKRNVTTPYHPAGNGKTERCHRFLNDIIAKGIQDRLHTEWEDMIPGALFAMRTCVNESTKYTPYMLVYGRDPVLPLDTLLAPRRRYLGDDYVPTSLQRLHTSFIHVADNTRHAREEYQRQANKRAAQRQFEAGDPVFLHDPVVRDGQMKKLCSPWTPHYRIVEMLTPVTAVIRCQKTGDYRTVHVNNIRYANIDGEWDDRIEKDQVFPQQNTKKLLVPQRRQPMRQAKLASHREHHLTHQTDSESDSGSDTEEEKGTDARRSILISRPEARTTQPDLGEQSTSTDIQRAIVTTAIPEKSTSPYNLRSKRDEEMDIAGTDNGLNPSSTKGVMNPEDDEMMLDNDADDKSLDDVATPRARHDSDSTVIYDLDDPLERSNRPTLGQTPGRKREHQEESDDDELGLPCKRVHADESSDDEKTDVEVADDSMTLDSLSNNLIDITGPSDGPHIAYSMCMDDTEYETADEQ